MEKIRFHELAQEEYRESYAWYSERSVEAADRLEAESDRVIDLIINRPQMFPQYDVSHRIALLHRFPFAIVFRIEPGEIVIVAFAHGSREVGYWEGRD